MLDLKTIFMLNNDGLVKIQERLRNQDSNLQEFNKALADCKKRVIEKISKLQNTTFSDQGTPDDIKSFRSNLHDIKIGFKTLKEFGQANNIKSLIKEALDRIFDKLKSSLDSEHTNQE
ncbi:MAG: hypothetical protein RLZZ361_602, partial [Cyanobacteriota bacterium]